MPVRSSDRCPCGSGKLHKDCCQPYYPLVEKAMTAFSKGQKAAGKQILDQIIVKYGTNYPVWLYRAEYFFALEDTTEAEKSLEKALELNPNAGLAHFLKGELRRKEGEDKGALILYRKALELLPYPNNTTLLARIGYLVANLELPMGHPLAAKAAILPMLKDAPTDQQLKDSLENVLGEGSSFPESARNIDRFRPQFVGTPSTKEWQAVIGNGADTKLFDLMKGTAELAQKFPDNPAAWFNAGFAKALWGDQIGAIADLLKSLELDNNPDTQAETGAIIVILRLGNEFASEIDYFLETINFRITNGESYVGFLRKKTTEGRFNMIDTDREQGILIGVFNDGPSPLGATDKQTDYITAALQVTREFGEIRHTERRKLEGLLNEMMEHDPKMIDSVEPSQRPCVFADTLFFRLPAATRSLVESENFDAEVFTKAQVDGIEKYLEDSWVNTPLKALNNSTPLEASKNPKLQKFLRGYVRYIDETAHRYVNEGGGIGYYDTNRLRRKLGLLSGSDSVDFDVMSAEDLAGVQTAKLTDEQLLKGFHAAMRHNAPETASKFALPATTRSTIGDRFVYFNHLMGQATGDDVIKLLDDAIASDAATNNASRAKDLSLRKSRLLLKGGQTEAGLGILDSLIAADAGNLNLYGTATETLLGVKQASLALKYAETGQALAKKANDKDRLGYFGELIAATKKQIEAETPPPPPPAETPTEQAPATEQ